MPLSGPSQQLARALVGTLLVGGAFLGSTGAATAAALPVSQDVTSSAVEQDAGAITARADQDVQRSDGGIELSAAHQAEQDTRVAQHAGAPGGT